MMVKAGPRFPSHLLPSVELHLPVGASPPFLAFPGTWEVKVQHPGFRDGCWPGGGASKPQQVQGLGRGLWGWVRQV